MAESSVQRAGQKRLEERGAVAFNQWGTPISGSGVPDQLNCYRGVFLALEWKHPNAKLHNVITRCNDHFATTEQRFHLDAIRKAGGVAWVVNRVTHVDQALDAIDEGLANGRH
jgi:hypothetical protein